MAGWNRNLLEFRRFQQRIGKICFFASIFSKSKFRFHAAEFDLLDSAALEFEYSKFEIQAFEGIEFEHLNFDTSNFEETNSSIWGQP